MAKEKVELNKKIILGPRITEKAVIGADKSGIYAFNVTRDANKVTISQAIKEAYKVTPVKVRVLNSKPLNVFVRGKKGTTSASKKAYVYLKKGEKIEVI